MPNKSFEIVILAAGKSTRFGSDKRVHTLKKLLDVIINSNGAQVATVFCVLRSSDKSHLEELLGSAMQLPNLHLLWNENADAGMGSSLALAARHLHSDAAMIFLGDMPYVQIKTIDTLLDRHEKEKIIVPVYGKERQQGHPVIFPQAYFAQLALLSGDKGAKSLLRQHEKNVVVIEVEDRGVVLDVDRPEDLLHPL